MIDSLFIFCAEKMFLLSPVIAAWFFYKSARETKIEMAIFAFFSLPLTFIISILAKELYFNPLPFVVKGFNPLISHAPNNGFPSDHVLLLAAIASVVMFFGRRTAIYLWAITLLVGLSRMYVGIHHFVDVVGSTVIALIAAFVVEAVLRWRKRV